ncbi:hypothetical protein KAFR_0C05520 [Kazachstania africana CBS 2517]|uniref:Dolichyl-diphosphooligosaccharide--protein glycosyltransferase subunit OST6 n=1 Tax=Kazachstania africana (strain ATCC 22294 / BCRC 22015 / CBS 2517 / CECT 1963 / NBRC 1671 / NRRL Y-8276) TaxID=1071382 RepID=H2AT43_KAZAF|nr:hypothetical protein KAFR_0C05520 [Kazachstania africana CBS 2517]CCF57543.1 hypothetical protein KAFR_0C05520 [Kazachstania africana CBS 2517]
MIMIPILVVLYLLAFFQKTVNALLDINDILPLKDGDNIITAAESNYNQLKQGVRDQFNVLYITMHGIDEDTKLVKCALCYDFEKNYRRVSKLIQQQAPDTPVTFFMVDVIDVPGVVKDMNLTKVPHLVIYPPSNDDDSFSWISSPFYQYPLTAQSTEEDLHYGNYLAKILGIHLEIDEPFKVQEFISYFCICILPFIVVKKLIMPYITNKSKVACMLLSFGILLASISGFKFTQMNGIPFIAKNDKNEIMYFSGGMGWQFGIEVFSVSLMYSIMAASSVFLILMHQYDLFGILKYPLSVLLASFLFYFFAYYISCFEIKSPGYPYMY